MALTKVSGDFIQSGSITQGHLHTNHGITTTHIAEGDKLFFTNARVDARIQGSLSTSDLSEGANLYYTDARARAAISVSGNALSYNSSTGVITSNYEESPIFTGNVTIDDGKIIFERNANNEVALEFSNVDGVPDDTAKLKVQDKGLLWEAGGTNGSKLWMYSGTWNSTVFLNAGTFNIRAEDSTGRAVFNSAGLTITNNLDVDGGNITLGGTGRIQGIDTVSANTDAANKLYVDNQVAGIVDSAPGTLDTLNELAAALGDDANFSTTVTNSIATKLPLAGGTLTGALSGTSATFSGIGQFAGAIKITETGTSQNILIGNQDSGGANKPAMINGVNGHIRIGYGNSWSGEGGTFTSQMTFNADGAEIIGSSSSNNAFKVTRGDGGGQAFRVQNAGEVVVSNNYFYAAGSGTSMYVQNTAVFRGNIVNDGAAGVVIGDDLTVNDTLFVSEYIRHSGNTNSHIRFQNNRIGIFANSGTAGYIDLHDNGNVYIGASNSTAATFTSSGVTFTGTITASGYNNSNWDTAYGWGNHASAGYLTSYTETDTLATVTARGASTSTAVTLSNMGNHYQGHFYWDAYSADGAHYPHFLDGGNANGVDVNWRLYTGSTNSVTHLWNVTKTEFRNQLHTTVDARAPIYYDRNNTAFFTDPASTSVVNILKAGSTGGSWGSTKIATSTDAGWGTSGSYPFIGSGPGSTGSIIMLHNPHVPFRTDNSRSGASGRAGLRCAINTSATNYWDIGLIGDEFEIFRNASSTQIFRADPNGNTFSSASSRAPIFYDSNDTAKYLNPNGTSILDTVKFSGSTNNGRFFGDSWGLKLQTDSGYIQFGPANTSHAHIYTDRSNFYFDKQIQLLGGSLINQNDIRAQIFYDLNNTGYYIDPASTSIVNTVYFGNNTNNGFVSGYGTYSLNIGRVAQMSLDWNANYNNPSNHGIMSTDSAGNFADSVSINSYNDITLRLDSNNNNATSALRVMDGTTQAADIFVIDQAAKATLGRSGFNPQLSLMYLDSGSGAGWDTSIHIGRTDDLPNGTGFPTYTATGGYGIQFQANSDGVFYGMKQYTTGHYRPYINWGDDTSDSPMEIAYNGTAKFTLSYDGINYATGSHRAPIFYDSNNTAYRIDLSDSGNSIVGAGSYNAASYNKPGLLLNASGTGSSGAAFGMQQVTAEGWTGVFVDYEPYTGWGLYHDNPNNYFCVTSESSSGGIRSFTVPSRSSGNRTAYEKIRFDQNGGDIQSGGSIYANAFYYRTNTGYVANPAGTSVMYRVELDNKLDMRAQTGTWIESNVMSDAIGWNASYGVYIGSNVGGTHYLRGNGTFTTGGNTYNLLHAGNWTGTVNYLPERSTITYGLTGLQFTDISGTGGAGTNGNAPGNPFSDWHYHMIMNHGNNNGYYADFAISFHNDRMHFRRVVANSFNTWREIYHSGSTNFSTLNMSSGNAFTSPSGGTIKTSSNFYAERFYDYDDTTRYVDVNSTSYIATLHTSGTIQAGNSGTGNIYIGNTGVSGSGNHFRFHTNNSQTYFDMNCGTINWRQGSSTRYYFYPSTANMTINGTLTQYSDIRYKTNIVEIPDAIDKVKSIRGVYYNRTDFNTEPTKIGVIAQEVEVLMPELILQAEDTDLKSVSYNELTAVLVQAIKEQQTIIDDLKTRIETLENQ